MTNYWMWSASILIGGFGMSLIPASLGRRVLIVVLLQLAAQLLLSSYQGKWPWELR